MHQIQRFRKVTDLSTFIFNNKKNISLNEYEVLIITF